VIRERDPSADGDDVGASEDAELGRVLEAYLAGIEAGRPADPAQLVAAHPAIARQLHACLQVMNVADRMVEASGSASGLRRPLAHLDSTMVLSGQSVLTSLGSYSSTIPQVHLRDLPDEPEPLIRPRSTEMPTRNGANLGRYQLQGEIARGGMGAILKGRDVDLGRELAIKVLLESHEDNPEVVSRFVEEAQIGGQLQHPGIVPVYELGTFPDRRPFFAMKLVKGRTLAALLAERKHRDGRGSPDPALPLTEGLPVSHVDLPRFLQIFEQICQTMAYAHARGVIHRDLKPSNVMVGSFGEVQVMDWGLAKVLPAGGIADEAPAQPINETVITTIRSRSAGSGGESQAGSVLGTPAYMAPEQARGEMDQIDERADVFGLGAILCEILTGQPPFVGLTREEIRTMAARGDLNDASSRLDASSADAQLIGLARECLAAEPVNRPRRAGDVVHRLSAYLADVQRRLKTAELARVEAQARAFEERKRRRLTVALAASVLVTGGVVGSGWAYLVRQRLERSARFNQAVSEADALYDEAARRGNDLARWLRAREAAHAAERQSPDAPDDRGRERATALVQQVTQATTAAETDQKLLARLVDIRSARYDDRDGSATDVDYADAFREAKFDVTSLPPVEAAAKIYARPSAVRLALAAALDDWASVRWLHQRDQAGARRLIETSRLVDPDPWRDRLRILFQNPDSTDRLTRLSALGSSARTEQLPAVSLHLLGALTFDLGDPATAEAVLSEGQRRYPSDVWLNLSLAQCLEGLARRDEAIRYYMAARSLRPETAHRLAHVLDEKGESVQAIALLRDTARLRPMETGHLNCLGTMLRDRGRRDESKVVFDAAVTAARAQIRRRPESARAHNQLGSALMQVGKSDEAITEYRDAVRLMPDEPSAHYDLGLALERTGKLDGAITAFRAALRLKHAVPGRHTSLGRVLAARGELAEAIAEYREAIRLDPVDFPVHLELGATLCDKKNDYEGAATEFRKAIRLKPNSAEAHHNLAIALGRLGKRDDAIGAMREAIRLKPDYAGAHGVLGSHLYEQGKLDDAIAEFREELRVQPNSHEARYGLGAVLNVQGKFEEAIAELRATIRLDADYLDAHITLGAALLRLGKRDEALAEFREALRLKPDSFGAHNNLGGLLAEQGKSEEAIAEFREALRLKPDFVDVRYNLGGLLAEQGKLDEAIVELREATRLKPGDPEVHTGIGKLLERQEKPGDAIAEYRSAIRLKPDYAEARCNLGLLFLKQGRLDEALAELKRGHELGSNIPNWQYPSAQWVREADRMVELDRKLPMILSGHGKPSDAAESLVLAQMCHAKKLHGASARLWAEAFRAQPNLADDMKAQSRYNAACAAALAGSGQGKDDRPLDEVQKARWRKQAIVWLEADLAAWSKILESSSPQVRQVIIPTLQHWKADTDLAGLRSAAALAKLPEYQQKACRALWAEVDALLAKSGKPKAN
jgi:eukaryotic-like serine/threonine-protein kinase